METSPNQLDPKITLEKLLTLMGIDAKVDEITTDGVPMLHIETEDAGRLIGKFGQTLNDVQFILNRMLYKQSGASPENSPDAPRPPRVIIDVAQYRERLRDDLLKIAHEAADKVRRWGDPVQLEPMNSFDRRIVHRAFTDDPEIETYSSNEEWEGGRKRITLQLRQSQPASDNPEPSREG